MESLEAGQFYADGHAAAMMWNWAGFGSMAEDPDSAVFGDVNYGLIPEPTLPGVGTRRSPSSTASRSQPGASMRISPTSSSDTPPMPTTTR